MFLPFKMTLDLCLSLSSSSGEVRRAWIIRDGRSKELLQHYTTTASSNYSVVNLQKLQGKWRRDLPAVTRSFSSRSLSVLTWETEPILTYNLKTKFLCDCWVELMLIWIEVLDTGTFLVNRKTHSPECQVEECFIEGHSVSSALFILLRSFAERFLEKGVLESCYQ